MSQNSTPGHTSPNSFDSPYDPSFSAEITSKMRVPDKIRVIEGADPPDLIMQQPFELKSKMNVPERILVAGDNQHIALRESLPELKYDAPFPVNFPNLVLAAPPNVLTVDEYPYAPADVRPKKTEVKKKYLADAELHNISELHDTSLNTTLNPEDEILKLRAQVRQLNRRVLDIEQENQQRQQREIIFCAFGGFYIFIKTLLWLHRHL